MNRIFPRIVALVIIPCLISDPVTASGFQAVMSRAPALPQSFILRRANNVLNMQALAAMVLAAHTIPALAATTPKGYGKLIEAKPQQAIAAMQFAVVIDQLKPAYTTTKHFAIYAIHLVHQGAAANISIAAPVVGLAVLLGGVFWLAPIVRFVRDLHTSKGMDDGLRQALLNNAEKRNPKQKKSKPGKSNEMADRAHYRELALKQEAEDQKRAMLDQTGTDGEKTEKDADTTTGHEASATVSASDGPHVAPTTIVGGEKLSDEELEDLDSFNLKQHAEVVGGEKAESLFRKMLKAFLALFISKKTSPEKTKADASETLETIATASALVTVANSLKVSAASTVHTSQSKGHGAVAHSGRKPSAVDLPTAPPVTIGQTRIGRWVRELLQPNSKATEDSKETVTAAPTAPEKSAASGVTSEKSGGPATEHPAMEAMSGPPALARRIRIHSEKVGLDAQLERANTDLAAAARALKEPDSSPTALKLQDVADAAIRDRKIENTRVANTYLQLRTQYAAQLIMQAVQELNLQPLAAYVADHMVVVVNPSEGWIYAVDFDPDHNNAVFQPFDTFIRRHNSAMDDSDIAGLYNAFGVPARADSVYSHDPIVRLRNAKRGEQGAAFGSEEKPTSGSSAASALPSVLLPVVSVFPSLTDSINANKLLKTPLGMKESEVHYVMENAGLNVESVRRTIDPAGVWERFFAKNNPNYLSKEADLPVWTRSAASIFSSVTYGYQEPKWQVYLFEPSLVIVKKSDIEVYAINLSEHHATAKEYVHDLATFLAGLNLTPKQRFTAYKFFVDFEALSAAKQEEVLTLFSNQYVLAFPGLSADQRIAMSALPVAAPAETSAPTVKSQQPTLPFDAPAAPAEAVTTPDPGNGSLVVEAPAVQPAPDEVIVEHAATATNRWWNRIIDWFSNLDWVQRPQADPRPVAEQIRVEQLRVATVPGSSLDLLSAEETDDLTMGGLLALMAPPPTAVAPAPHITQAPTTPQPQAPVEPAVAPPTPEAARPAAPLERVHPVAVPIATPVKKAATKAKSNRRAIAYVENPAHEKYLLEQLRRALGHREDKENKGKRDTVVVMSPSNRTLWFSDRDAFAEALTPFLHPEELIIENGRYLSARDARTLRQIHAIENAIHEVRRGLPEELHYTREEVRVVAAETGLSVKVINQLWGYAVARSNKAHQFDPFAYSTKQTAFHAIVVEFLKTDAAQKLINAKLAEPVKVERSESRPVQRKALPQRQPEVLAARPKNVIQLQSPAGVINAATPGSKPASAPQRMTYAKTTILIDFAQKLRNPETRRIIKIVSAVVLISITVAVLHHFGIFAGHIVHVLPPALPTPDPSTIASHVQQTMSTVPPIPSVPAAAASHVQNAASTLSSFAPVHVAPPATQDAIKETISNAGNAALEPFKIHVEHGLGQTVIDLRNAKDTPSWLRDMLGQPGKDIIWHGPVQRLADLLHGEHGYLGDANHYDVMLRAGDYHVHAVAQAGSELAKHVPTAPSTPAPVIPDSLSTFIPSEQPTHVTTLLQLLPLSGGLASLRSRFFGSESPRRRNSGVTFYSFAVVLLLLLDGLKSRGINIGLLVTFVIAIGTVGKSTFASWLAQIKWIVDSISEWRRAGAASETRPPVSNAGSINADPVVQSVIRPREILDTLRSGKGGDADASEWTAAPAKPSNAVKAALEWVNTSAGRLIRIPPVQPRYDFDKSSVWLAVENAWSSKKEEIDPRSLSQALEVVFETILLREEKHDAESEQPSFRQTNMGSAFQQFMKQYGAKYISHGSVYQIPGMNVLFLRAADEKDSGWMIDVSGSKMDMTSVETVPKPAVPTKPASQPNVLTTSPVPARSPVDHGANEWHVLSSAGDTPRIEPSDAVQSALKFWNSNPYYILNHYLADDLPQELLTKVSALMQETGDEPRTLEGLVQLLNNAVSNRNSLEPSWLLKLVITYPPKGNVHWNMFEISRDVSLLTHDDGRVFDSNTIWYLVDLSDKRKGVQLIPISRGGLPGPTPADSVIPAELFNGLDHLFHSDPRAASHVRLDGAA